MTYTYTRADRAAIKARFAIWLPADRVSEAMALLKANGEQAAREIMAERLTRAAKIGGAA